MLILLCCDVNGWHHFSDIVSSLRIMCPNCYVVNSKFISHMCSLSLPVVTVAIFWGQ